jgi:hypothetical protein
MLNPTIKNAKGDHWAGPVPEIMDMRVMISFLSVVHLVLTFCNLSSGTGTTDGSSVLFHTEVTFQN